MSLVIAISQSSGELFSNSTHIENARELTCGELMDKLIEANIGFDSHGCFVEVLIVENDRVAKFLREELWYRE